MKPGKFTYHAPDSLEAAFGLLGEYGDDAKVIAGGQSLVPVMNFRLAQPEHLIDINGIGKLAGIRDDDGRMVVGALTRHIEMERSTLLAEQCPILCVAAKQIGHLAIRSRGTVGGSLANADPAAEWSLMAVLLDAEMTICSVRGDRTARATDFIQSIYTSDLEADELLTEIFFSTLASDEGWALQQISRRAGDFAIVAVAATVALGADGRVARLRLALGGMDATPVRLTTAEEDAVGKTPDGDWIKLVSGLAAKAGAPESDMHASATYRTELAEHLTAEALVEALERCGGGI